MKSSLPKNTKYEVQWATRFKKQYKTIQKQGKTLLKLQKIVSALAEGEPLPIKNRNHKLVDSRDYKECWECHIDPDWLLIYQYQEDELILLLVATGSHSELFK